ncbi:hypothetical protein H8356DRAFT_1345528 [Neocallimastix lanati (nom. inval.)]|nr:hypothetical protein H8356DRAFT_1345528 [Neocallimastix sp. JGI-2020a]
MTTKKKQSSSMTSQFWKHFTKIISMTFNDIVLDLIHYIMPSTSKVNSLMVIQKGEEIDDMTMQVGESCIGNNDLDKIFVLLT